MVPTLRHRLKGPSLPPPWEWGHGLVLRKKILGEEDLSLEIFFLKKGILEGLVRRGALPTVPYPGSLEPPAVTFFHFQRIAPERVRIRHWEERRTFPRARAAPDILLEISHALSSLLPRGWWDPGLFRCAFRSLQALERGRNPEEVRLSFRLGVLEVTGHSPWHLLGKEKSQKRLEEVVEKLWPHIISPRRRETR